MRESIHQRIRAPENAKAIEMGRRAGYKTGGKITPAEKKAIRKAVHKHEEHDHEGEPLTRIKRGGHIHGKEPKARLDKKPRKAMGGPMSGGMPMQQPGMMTGMPQQQAPGAQAMTPRPAIGPGGMKKGGDVKKRARGGRSVGSAPEAYHEGTRATEMKMKQPETNVDKEAPPRRAMGGPIKGKRPAKTNIIIHAGGGGDQQGDMMKMQQAHQAGMQQGMKAGAMAVMQKLKGAGGAPGGAPPGAPPMPGAGGPPGGGMAPGMAPMHAKGGRVREQDPKPKLHKTPETVKVRAHTRKRGGAC